MPVVRRKSETDDKAQAQSSFKLIDDADTMQPGRQGLEFESALSKRVPVSFFRANLADRVNARHLIRDFLLHVPFVVAFVFFMFGRRSIAEEYFFSESVKNHLTRENMPPTNPLPGSAPNTLPYFPKPYYEIGNHWDVYDWIESTLTPRLFSDDPAWRQPSTPYFHGQNHLIGALRIRTKHVNGRSCQPNNAWYPNDRLHYPRTCYGPLTDENEQRGNFTPNGVTYSFFEHCHDYPLQFIVGKYATYGCEGYKIDIPFTQPLSEVFPVVVSFRTNSLFQTVSARLIVFEFFTYNPAVKTFMAVKLMVEITEGGGFLPWARVRPFVVFPGSAGWIVYNIFFLLLVLFYFFRFVIDWIRNTRMTRSKLNFLMSVWNIMQLANLLLFIPVYALYFMWMYYSQKVDQLFGEHAAEYPEVLSAVAELYITQVYVNAVNTIFTFLTLLKFVKLNQRLNILQRTVAKAVQPLLAVLIIFLIVVTAYSLAGTLIFGTGVESFRNVDTAFVSLFRCLIGDFDYWALWGENRALAFVYFWTFIVLGLFMLLNFIVAIMMGAFKEENAKLKPKSIAVIISETIHRQRYTILTRIKKFATIICTGQQMPEDILLEVLNEYLENYQVEYSVADEFEDVEVENLEFGRYDFGKLLPQAELDDIGEDYLDSLWFAVVDDYSNTLSEEVNEEHEDLTRQTYEHGKEAATEALYDYKRKLFQDEEFIRQWEAHRTYDYEDELTDEEVDDYESVASKRRAGNSLAQLRSVPLRLPGGKMPVGVEEVIAAFARKGFAVQRHVMWAAALALHVTRRHPPPTTAREEDAAQTVKPPQPPPFSGQISAGPNGELPNRMEARKKALKVRRQQAATTSSGPPGAALDPSSAQTADPFDFAAVSASGPTPPETAPSATAAPVIDSINGAALPQGGQWMRCDSDEFVWSRTKQAFLHLPTGHLCSADGTRWFVVGISDVWVSVAERTKVLAQQVADATRLQAEEVMGDVYTFNTRNSRLQRWPASVAAVPPLLGRAMPNKHWQPSALAFSPPPTVNWAVVDGRPGFYRFADLYFYAPAGTFLDGATGLWYIPAAGSWVTPIQHETYLQQRRALAAY
jgi:hypothetical protein